MVGEFLPNTSHFVIQECANGHLPMENLSPIFWVVQVIP